MIQSQIPSLLQTFIDRYGDKEAIDFEYKTARSKLPTNLWDTVSAFANTHGGWIVLGVVQGEDGQYIAEGVQNASDILQTFHDLVRNPQKVSFPVCGSHDAETSRAADDGTEVVVIRIPAASRTHRPVYINGNPYSGTFVRRHGGDYHCTKQEVDRMMREASEVAADATILSRFGFSDLDLESLARYRRRHQTLNPGSPWTGHDDPGFLRAIGGFGRDRDRGEEGITGAGVLMFGTEEALRDLRGRHLIDYREVADEGDVDRRWENRIAWGGNLYSAFELMYPRLVADQPVPFRLERGTRIGEGDAHIALREALVNLLVHTDYAETQASLIVRSPAGYRFRNPGNSRVAEADLLRGGSDPRNPRLVQMFRYVGLAEEAGTGIPKIIEAWRALGYRGPAINVGTERYEFSLELRHSHFLAEDERIWLHGLGERFTEAERMALVRAKRGETVDNQTLSHITGQHPADTTKTLGGLRKQGLLIKQGAGRGVHYELGPHASDAYGWPGLPPVKPRSEDR
ncbi:MAG: putative DNA binding domain-containing protein, partial [Chloroflexia bacterium]|nr:putative DNA binding domain-containing protein [Chloroflexia bacterium]